MGRDTDLIRRYLKLAKKQGFQISRNKGNSHTRVTNPDTGEYCHFSDHSGSDKALSALRSRLRGIGVKGV